VGKWLDNTVHFFQEINNSNITYTGYVSDDELCQWMSKAKVYGQLSFHEGFGCSLAEAMLFECIPVVTARGAIPEVVSDRGCYVPYGNIKAIANAIYSALEMDETLGCTARERILREFPFEHRAQQLLTLVRNVGSPSPRDQLHNDVFEIAACKAADNR
jgi:glycosyltransferase involved in cell wall biosynthesis